MRLTAQQHKQVMQLAQCRFKPGCFEKGFIGDMRLRLENPNYEYSQKQIDALQLTARRYRRQMSKKEV